VFTTIGQSITNDWVIHNGNDGVVFKAAMDWCQAANGILKVEDSTIFVFKEDIEITAPIIGNFTIFIQGSEQTTKGES